MLWSGVEWLLTSAVLCLQGEEKEGGDDAMDEAGASDDAEAPSVPRTLPLLSEDELGRAKKVRAAGRSKATCLLCSHLGRHFLSIPSRLPC